MKRTNEKLDKGNRLNKAAGWAVLTWDDLDRWAGSRSVSRGRSYQNQGRVKDLAISADDRLLATVQGGDRYVVSVWLNAGKSGMTKSNPIVHVRSATTASTPWRPLPLTFKH